MITSNFIFEITLDWVDVDKIKTEAEDDSGYEKFVDPSNGFVFDEWFIKKINSGYAYQVSEQIRKMIGSNDCRPRFYKQNRGFNLGFHKDRDTQCSINFVLTGKEDEVSFEQFSIPYSVALLNTSEYHAVTDLTSDRVLFKISIFDLSYQEVYNILLSNIPRTFE